MRNLLLLIFACLGFTGCLFESDSSSNTIYKNTDNDRAEMSLFGEVKRITYTSCDSLQINCEMHSEMTFNADGNMLTTIGYEDGIVKSGQENTYNKNGGFDQIYLYEEEKNVESRYQYVYSDKNILLEVNKYNDTDSLSLNQKYYYTNEQLDSMVSYLNGRVLDVKEVYFYDAIGKLIEKHIYFSHVENYRRIIYEYKEDVLKKRTVLNDIDILSYLKEYNVNNDIILEVYYDNTSQESYRNVYSYNNDNRLESIVTFASNGVDNDSTYYTYSTEGEFLITQSTSESGYWYTKNLIDDFGNKTYSYKEYKGEFRRLSIMGYEYY